MSNFKIKKAPQEEGSKSLEGSSGRNIKKNIKSRAWTWVVYEEQIEKVREWLEGSPEIAWAMSPKHSDDLNPDGTPKKPHWHLCVHFPGPTTYNVAKGMSDEMSLPIPQDCRNTRGMVRYFLHLDHPDKAKYTKSEITAGGGFDVEEYLKLSQSEKDREERLFMSKLLDICTELDLQVYNEVADYVLTELPEMYQHFRRNHFVIKEYLYARHRYGAPGYRRFSRPAEEPEEQQPPF